MKGSRDLRAVDAELRALIARDDVDPDQKRHVEAAIIELRALRRKRKREQADVYACVRKVAEHLLRAFYR